MSCDMVPSPNPEPHLTRASYPGAVQILMRRVLEMDLSRHLPILMRNWAMQVRPSDAGSCRSCRAKMIDLNLHINTPEPEPNPNPNPNPNSNPNPNPVLRHGMR